MKVLVANRGEIAARVIRSVQELGHTAVAIASDVDKNAMHAWLADEVVTIGEPRAYLDIEKVLGAAMSTQAGFVHPGYGFLSENPKFAQACAKAGVAFVGPPPEAMERFADKRAARLLAANANVSVVPGAVTVDSADDAKKHADGIGYPVLLKAAAGGGGKGMRRVQQSSDIEASFAAATREAQGAFGDGRLLVEKYVYPARHIEVQILADDKRAVALGERECSLQRRYQKIIEEAPSPSLKDTTRATILEAASRLMESAGYRNAGTVEFLLGPDDDFYFLEVNARLQVEHPVTELVTGLDLVAWQLAIAEGGQAPDGPSPRGHAIEARLNAEDAYGGFLPASGEVGCLRWPQLPGVRIDAGMREGDAITAHYDSMIAKVIAWAPNREQARARLAQALRESTILGLHTNQTFLLDVLNREFFIDAQTFTSTVEEETWHAPELPEEVLALAKRYADGPQAASHGVDGSSTSAWEHVGAFRLGQRA